ncbi:Rsp5p-dependent ubiquitination, sorting of cargo proteins at the multivesicular body [Modicella reniformis]|uniref:Rsp5p-dependent ubiquitination, sorting of cargo proteins at the multivesicular body n=1 Tax=Modicella reniformis TaxID=1440133 RepID=A0A9P6J0V8_9FUNG|nr:Rsp5p-dependent ubiquitination, sorting of cargo proteins at the multivesicular body [Modicella reniformis]
MPLLPLPPLPTRSLSTSKAFREDPESVLAQESLLKSGYSAHELENSLQAHTRVASPSEVPDLSPFQELPVQYPVQYPTEVLDPVPSPPESNDEEATWLVILILTAAVIITLTTVIRSCGRKAGWLTGSSTSSSGRQGASASGRDIARGRSRIHGPSQVPTWEVDPEATEARLASLSDIERQAYDAAQAFQLVHSPNSVPTDISLSQYLSIQEKGVSAWEFEPSYDHQLYVHDRTELSFFDQVACVQTNLPLPKQQEVYYWEVKMFEKSPNTTIAVGVTTKPYPTTRLPGWNRYSAGYFSNDGQKYCNSPWNGCPFGPTYFEGDVIGCGYRPRNGTIFFTRNGRRIDDAYTGFGRTNLFPTVGATGPCVLHVNFGQSGFVFVEANVKKWGLAPATGSLAPPPAYGSEYGSILLETAGSAPTLPSSPSSSRRPILQSNSSRTHVHAAGVLRLEDSTRGASVPDSGVGESSRVQGGRSLPVQTSLSNMSAPPPNYSSLDRFGRAPRDSVDTASVASTDSDELTLLLSDARRDPESGRS